MSIIGPVIGSIVCLNVAAALMFARRGYLRFRYEEREEIRRRNFPRPHLHNVNDMPQRRSGGSWAPGPLR